MGPRYASEEDMDSPLASRAVSPFGGWFQRWRQRVFHRDPTEHDQCLATRARLRAAVFLPYSRLVQNVDEFAGGSIPQAGDPVPRMFAARQHTQPPAQRSTPPVRAVSDSVFATATLPLSSQTRSPEVPVAGARDVCSAQLCAQLTDTKLTPADTAQAASTSAAHSAGLPPAPTATCAPHAPNENDTQSKEAGAPTSSDLPSSSSGGPSGSPVSGSRELESLPALASSDLRGAPASSLRTLAPPFAAFTDLDAALPVPAVVPFSTVDARRQALHAQHSMNADQARVDAGLMMQIPPGITVQQIVLEAEPGLQGRIPCCIVKHESTRGTAPVVIWLHATGASTVAMLPRLYNYAALGFLAVSMDCRYHGARTPAEDNGLKYQEAVFKAWQTQQERPFLLDNIKDLHRLLNYLETRDDVDHERIGMAGISLGGMHTWLFAAMDTRIAAACPLIGVQDFGWAIDNNAYHGRVDSLKFAFEAIARSEGKRYPDASLVKRAWQRLLPGLLEHYDCPKSLPCIAPRPLLVVNGADDPRCPVPGLQAAIRRCKAVYRAHRQSSAFRVLIQPGVGHEVTPEMNDAVEAWFCEVLKPDVLPIGRLHSIDEKRVSIEALGRKSSSMRCPSTPSKGSGNLLPPILQPCRQSTSAHWPAKAVGR